MILILILTSFFFLLESANDGCFSPAYKFPSSVIIPKVSTIFFRMCSLCNEKFVRFYEFFKTIQQKIVHFIWKELHFILPIFQKITTHCILFRSQYFALIYVFEHLLEKFVNKKTVALKCGRFGQSPSRSFSI